MLLGVMLIFIGLTMLVLVARGRVNRFIDELKR